MANATARAAIMAATGAMLMTPAPLIANTRAGDGIDFNQVVTAQDQPERSKSGRKGGYIFDGKDGLSFLLPVGLVAAVFILFMEDGSLLGGSSRTGQGNGGGGFRSNGAG